MRLQDRPTPARILVVGRSQHRVNVLVEALKGDGLPAVGAISLCGVRTAIQEFPSLRTVVLLYADDVLAPFECVVFRLDGATVTNYYKLASYLGWEERACSDKNETSATAR